MRDRTAWLLAAALCVVAAAPSLARAQDQDQAQKSASNAAREKFLKGQQAYQQGDYDMAISQWKAAYDLDPRPLILYNLSQAYERNGKLAEAVDALQKYLHNAEPDDPNTELARARLASLQQRLNKTGIVITGAPAGADILVDGKSWGATPRPDPIPLKPGSHTVLLQRKGYQDFRATVGVPAGQRVTVQVQMRPGVAGPAPGEKPKKHEPGIGPYILGGTGAAVAIGGAVAGVIALKTAKTALYRNGSDADSAKKAALAADILGAAGGAALAGAIIWWLVDHKPSEESSQARVTITPAFGPDGAGAGATIRF